MPTVLSKSRKAPAQTKLCLHCNHTKPIAQFYANRGWVEQNQKDVWCKSCVSKCMTKDAMREYFFENNREFTDDLWANACKKAEQQCAKKTVYQKANEERKQVLLEQVACSIIPGIMQMTQNYKYIDNTQDTHTNTYEQAKENGKVIDNTPAEDTKRKADPNVKTYSHEFNGNFKPVELEYLEDYYKQLGEGFNLSDVSLRDNAKKLAKASLLVDKVQNDYMAGKCQLQDVKDAIAQYDLLLKTGNFAACKRKPEEKQEETSFSEITKYCETHGHPCTKKIEWPKDVVDQTLDALQYIAVAINDTLSDEVGDSK